MTTPTTGYKPPLFVPPQPWYQDWRVLAVIGVAVVGGGYFVMRRK